MAQPVDAVVVGQALNSLGFTANDATAGLGLNTFGFLWPCDGIWGGAQESVSTTWTSVIDGVQTTELCVDN